MKSVNISTLVEDLPPELFHVAGYGGRVTIQGGDTARSLGDGRTEPFRHPYLREHTLRYLLK